MVDELTTLEQKQVATGQTFSSFNVDELFLDIDIILKELLDQRVHETLLQMEPVLIMVGLLVDSEIVLSTTYGKTMVLIHKTLG